MSVINKMLRDLDRRANPAASAQPGPAALRQGTASVSMDTLAAQQPAVGGARLWLGLGLLSVAAASVGGWLWWSSTVAPPAPLGDTAAAPLVLVPPTVVASAATPVASEPTPTAAPAPLAAASSTGGDGTTEPSLASVFLRMEPSLSARKALDALLAAPAPVAASNSNPSTSSARTASPPAPVSAPTPVPTPTTSSAVVAAPFTAPAPSERAPTRAAGPKTPATAAAPSPASESTPVLQRQQQAGGDALSQVQALWSNGSRDAAFDLMQQSIAAAERSVRAGTAPGSSTTVLVPLVREMARMQLAESRFGAVWEMLTKLEPLLGNQPDLWAIRANAAQRLGRHQDSVHAYMMALQSRPNEQRWLLGTAVSLAALGQTSSAAEMAEKARNVGPISKEILAYLRQTGVPIREQ